MRKRVTSILFATVLLCSLPCNATVTVGGGSVVNFADAKIALGCADLIVAGQVSGTAATLNAIANLSINTGGELAPGASQITLGGNFTDAGAFISGSSRVGLVDACGNGTSTVSGATGFYDFVVTTATGKQLVLPAGMTQTITHMLTLQGASGNLLNIASSSSGSRALFAVSATALQTVDYVNARDNAATSATIAPGSAATYHSIDSGGLDNWFASAAITAATPTPMLGASARTILLLTILLAAAFGLRRRGRAGWL